MFKSFFDRFRKKEDEEKELEKDSLEESEDLEEDVLREEKIEEEKEQAVPTKIEEEKVEEEKDLQEPVEILKEKVQEEVEVSEPVEIREDKVQEEVEKSQPTEIRQEEVEEEKAQEVPTVEVEKEEIVEEPEESVGFLGRLKRGLQKTRDQLASQIDEVLAPLRTVDAEMMEELEEVLITSDLGVQTTMTVMDTLDERIRVKNIQEAEKVREELLNIIIELLEEKDLDNSLDLPSPTVVLVVGVNGVGKTTSIGKMAHRFKNEGKNVLMVAADTFRAAAIEQLEEWGTRANVPVIAHQEGSDPAAVIYDGIQAARSRKADILLCDTAGRLHNKANLMSELEKINRIIDRDFPEANKEVYIVVDGTTGQNAILQAREFKSVTDVSGAIITKLDGTARGGMVIPLELEEEIPVKLIGIGEQIEDLVDFVQEDFVEAIIK